MNRSRRWDRDLAIFGIGVAILGILVFGFGRQKETQKTPQTGGVAVRLAYFPNVTHAPALVGVARGEFQSALGASTLETKVVNAGPEAMEALLAGEIDVAYVGPSPAINTYIKSNGRALRVVAGACSGGASLMARADTNIQSVRDLDGKRVAVPQLGGTQDVSCRHFLAANGLSSHEKGGTVEIMPIKNPDILALFLQKQLDAAWVPEPWAARLKAEAGARLVVDERDLWPNRRFTTTVLVVRKAFLDAHPKEVEALLQAHLKVMAWLQRHPDEAQTTVNAELKRLTGKELQPEVLREAWSRVEFTEDPDRASMEAFVQAAVRAGYLPKSGTSVAGLFEMAPLESARRQVASAR